jgi:hypothetical protein
MILRDTQVNPRFPVAPRPRHERATQRLSRAIQRLYGQRSIQPVTVAGAKERINAPVFIHQGFAILREYGSDKFSFHCMQGYAAAATCASDALWMKLIRTLPQRLIPLTQLGLNLSVASG